MNFSRRYRKYKSRARLSAPLPFGPVCVKHNCLTPVCQVPNENKFVCCLIYPLYTARHILYVYVHMYVYTMYVHHVLYMGRRTNLYWSIKPLVTLLKVTVNLPPKQVFPQLPSAPSQTLLSCFQLAAFALPFSSMIWLINSKTTEKWQCNLAFPLGIFPSPSVSLSCFFPVSEIAAQALALLLAPQSSSIFQAPSGKGKGYCVPCFSLFSLGIYIQGSISILSSFPSRTLASEFQLLAVLSRFFRGHFLAGTENQRSITTLHDLPVDLVLDLSVFSL